MSNPGQPPAVPSAKRRLRRSLLAWGLDALGAWLLHAAIAAVHPAGLGPAWLGPDLGKATLAVAATACCTTPFVIGGLLLYVVLRHGPAAAAVGPGRGSRAASLRTSWAQAATAPATR